MEMGRSVVPSGMQAMTGTPVMISHMPLLSSCKRFPVWKRFRIMPCKGMFWLFKYAAVKPTWFSVPSPASATKRQERCWDRTKSAREKAAVSSWRRGQRMPPGRYPHSGQKETAVLSVNEKQSGIKPLCFYVVGESFC